MLKKILIAIVVLLAGLLAFAATRPDTYRVERSKVIAAPAEAAYAQIAEPVLVGLASRASSPQTKRRFAHHLQQAAPEHAERILADPAWDALATVLAEAEAA